MASRLNNIYWNMRKRCYYRNAPFYSFYGGRGISVCAEWMQGFKPFKEWALSHGYRDDLTIDRIDNNGNYEPSNCRWVTAKKQVANRSISLNFTLDGVTKTLAEWCEQFGVPYSSTRWRVKHWGFSRECFTGRLRDSRRRKVVVIKGGVKMSFASISEAARHFGVTDVAVGRSIARGGKCCGLSFKYERKK